MSYYLAHVKVDPKLGYPAMEDEARVRIEGFLRTTFKGNAFIHQEFGIGEMGEFLAVAIDIGSAHSNDPYEEDSNIRNLLSDWLQAQCTTGYSLEVFAEEDNPLFCPNGADDAELNSAVVRHYGILTL